MAQRLLRWLRRRWLLWVVIIAVVALAINRRMAIEELIATLRRGAWMWIVVGVLLQALFFVLYALGYKLAFAAVGVQSRVRDLLPLLFAAIFVSTVAPTGGLTGAALFVGAMAHYGQSPVRAAEGVLLEAVIENIALVPVLLIGLVALVFRHALVPYETVALVLYLAYTVGLGVALLLAYWYPSLLRRALTGLERLANRIGQALRRPQLLGAGWGERNAAEFQAAARAITRNPRLVGRTMAVALVRQGVNLATLDAFFRAFHYPEGLGTVAAGYAFGLAVTVISILPYEIGVFQSIMGLVYASLGVPVPVAIAVVLAFGGVKSWLPIAIGFVLFNRVQAFGGPKHDAHDDGDGKSA